METFGNDFTPKNAVFLCEKCKFKCSKKSDWNRHIQTIKHCQSDHGTKMETLENAGVANNKYKCECGKYYVTKSGLWKHKSKCFKVCEFNETEFNENKVISKLLQHLIKENGEMKNFMMQQQNFVLELCKNGIHNTNNSHNNSNNKTFNLNLFLNETCKNAMNISDFADSIKLQLSDLESVGELGYVNGISNIIIRHLKELDITQRPIHCTDAKRETLYIKDQDKWEREGEQKEKIFKFLSNIANKNIRMLSEFKKKYPDCCKYESKYSDYYSKLIIEAMGGTGGTEIEKNEKIIKKISKEVTIDKTIL